MTILSGQGLQALPLFTTFVNMMSLGQVLALRKLRKQASELTEEEREGYIYLLLCTVAGVQNTG